MTAINLSRAFVFSVSLGIASASHGQNSDADDCFGIDLTENSIAVATILKRDPEAFRAQAEQIETVSSCEEVALSLLDIADLKEINIVLDNVNTEIKSWNDTGRPTRYPLSSESSGNAILRLNELLSYFTTNEEFPVDNGFYVRSAETLLQVAEVRFGAEVTGAFIELQRHRDLYVYIEELSTSLPAVDSALSSYQASFNNFMITDAFFHCMNDSHLRRNSYEFAQHYNVAKLNSNSDPIMGTAGLCSVYYSLATTTTQSDIRQKLETALDRFMASPAAYKRH